MKKLFLLSLLVGIMTLGYSQTDYCIIEEIYFPLHFDIGTEPETAGNVSYGMIQYDWNRSFASRLDIRFSTNTDVKDSVEGYGNAIDTVKTTTFEVNILPYVKNFSHDTQKSQICFSAGISYQYTYLDEYAGMFDVNGIMLDEGDEGKYFTITNKKKAHFIAPRLGFTAKIPLSDKLRFNFEGFANPVYFMILNQDMSYQSNQTAHPFDYSGDNSFTRFSSPFIDTKISLDFYGMFRVMSRLNYQLLDFQQLDWNEKFDGLKGYDDVQTIITLRFGFEVLSMYQKSAKIRGGIYRQMEWTKSSYLNTTEKNGKWIFSLGTEL